MHRKKALFALVTSIWIGLGIIIFFQQRGQRSAPSVLGAQERPGLVLQDFWYRRFRQDSLQLELKGSEARLVGDRTVVIDGNVEFRQLEDSAWSEGGAGRAEVVFVHPVSKWLSGQGEIEKAWAEGATWMDLSDHHLEADRVDYDVGGGVISSDREVTVTGPTRRMVSRSGMKYNLSDKQLELTGPVSGVEDSQGKGQ